MKLINHSPANWARLGLVQIHLTRAILLVGDAVAAAVAAMLAVLGADRWSSMQDEYWLLSQDIQRYWAWLALVALGIGLFMVKYRHYSDRKPFWTRRLP